MMGWNPLYVCGGKGDEKEKGAAAAEINPACFWKVSNCVIVIATI
jgi:hypothetical protein